MSAAPNQTIFSMLRKDGVPILRLTISIPRSHVSSVAIDAGMKPTYAAAGERDWSEALDIATAGGTDPIKALATLMDAIAIAQAVLAKLADHAKEVADSLGIDLSSLTTIIKDEVRACLEGSPTCRNTVANLIAKCIKESTSAGFPKIHPEVFKYLGYTPPLGGGGFILLVG